MSKNNRTEKEMYRAASDAAGERSTKHGREVGTAQPENTGASPGATSPDSQEALKKLESENTDLKDRLMRALAETENVRRRAERDLEDMRQYAVTNFAGDMLRVADNLERALDSVPAEVREGGGAVKALIDGVELTEKEMLRSLNKHGVQPLHPLGERFDPNFHEALFEAYDPSVPSGTVNKIVETGYTIGSRLLRPAKVGVTSGGPPSRSPKN